MMKKLILMLIVAFACAGTADAQGWLKKLGKVAEDAAKRTVENNVDRKTTEAVDDAMNPDDSSSEENTSRSKKTDYDWDDEDAEEGPQDTEAQYEQSDFVPGAVAFFEDDLVSEQMGEFPSKWDLVDGSADVANMKGKKCIHFEPETRIEPLMTNQQSYIPDVFTLEFDFWMNDPKTEMSNCYELEFKDADGGDVYEIRAGFWWWQDLGNEEERLESLRNVFQQACPQDLCQQQARDQYSKLQVSRSNENPSGRVGRIPW